MTCAESGVISPASQLYYILLYFTRTVSCTQVILLEIRAGLHCMCTRDLDYTSYEIKIKY